MEGSSAVTNKEESGSIDYVYPPGVPVLQDLGLVGSAALQFSDWQANSKGLV